MGKKYCIVLFKEFHIAKFLKFEKINKLPSIFNQKCSEIDIYTRKMIDK